MVLLIWFGPVLMAFGGMLSLSDRRLARRRAEAGEGGARLAGGGVMT